jgi:hypothetical protein
VYLDHPPYNKNGQRGRSASKTHSVLWWLFVVVCFPRPLSLIESFVKQIKSWVKKMILFLYNINTMLSATILTTENHYFQSSVFGFISEKLSRRIVCCFVCIQRSRQSFPWSSPYWARCWISSARVVVERFQGRTRTGRMSRVFRGHQKYRSWQNLFPFVFFVERLDKK